MKIFSLMVLIFCAVFQISEASIMDKIRNYNNPAVQNMYNKALWFSSDSQAIEEYAAKVENSPSNPMGENAVYAFGMIGADSVTHPITVNNEPRDLALVASAPEYYFTDMVFVRGEFGAALVDLYYYRAEASGASSGPEYRAIIDEAIGGTYWVAAQNGVTISEVEIQEKFLASLDEQLEEAAISFNIINKGFVENIEEYTDKFIVSIKEYYLDPNITTFENALTVSFECAEANKSPFVTWSAFFTGILEPVSGGLAVAFVNHGRDMEDQLTMAPTVISPVEIGKKEKTLMFGGK